MSRAVVTADFGPDRQATAMPVENITGVKFDFAKNMVYIDTELKTLEFAYTGVTGVSFSISGGSTTVTIT